MEKLQSKAIRHMYRAIQLASEDGALEKLFTECPGLNKVEINSLLKWSYITNTHLGQFEDGTSSSEVSDADSRGEHAAKLFLIAMNVDNETDLAKYTRLRWLTHVLLTRIHLFVHDSNNDLANALNTANTLLAKANKPENLFNSSTRVDPYNEW